MATIVTLAVLATFYEIQWAENLILFFTPILLFLAFVVRLGLHKVEDENPELFKKARDEANKDPWIVTQCFYFILPLIFAYHRWFVMATCWFFIWVFAALSRDKIFNRRVVCGGMADKEAE